MNTSKPMFVCVPDISHPLTIYESLKVSLRLQGYIAMPLILPSMGGNPPAYDFQRDVATIRLQVTHLIDAGYDVIVVAHGWGGVTAGEALEGLGKMERERRGYSGGVLRIIFIMGWIVKEGFQGASWGDVTIVPGYLDPDLSTSMADPIPHIAKTALFNDMLDSQANFWSQQLLPQSLGVFWDRTTYAAWRHIPSSYVICGSDMSFPPSEAEEMIREAREHGIGIGCCLIDQIERCPGAGHEVMLTNISWTLEVLLRAAGEETF